jgi:hypothetical protein
MSGYQTCPYFRLQKGVLKSNGWYSSYGSISRPKIEWLADILYRLFHYWTGNRMVTVLISRHRFVWKSMGSSSIWISCCQNLPGNHVWSWSDYLTEGHEPWVTLNNFKSFPEFFSSFQPNPAQELLGHPWRQWCLQGQVPLPSFGFHPQWHPWQEVCLDPEQMLCESELQVQQRGFKN